MQLTLGILAAILNLVGYVPYIRDILRGKVKPHRYTWGMWAILTTIVAINQIKNGGGYSSIFLVSTCGLVIITFLLSMRYGERDASRIDKACLVLALGLLLYWLTVRDTRLSTLLAVIIDGLAALPTVLKTYHRPQTESYAQWILAAAAGFITLLTVPRWEWVLIIYPAYVMLMDGGIAGIKFWRERS